MRILRKVSRFVWQLWLMAIAIVLLAAAGCVLLRNDEDGQAEPPRLAEYVVTVSPSSRSEGIPPPPATELPISVQLSGSCVGDFIPPNCATHKPFWAVIGSPLFRGRVTFNNVESPNTIAIVYLDAAYYRNSLKPDPLTGFVGTIPLTFYPRAELRDVGVRRGRLDLNLAIPSPVPNEEEIPVPIKQM